MSFVHDLETIHTRILPAPNHGRTTRGIQPARWQRRRGHGCSHPSARRRESAGRAGSTNAHRGASATSRSLRAAFHAALLREAKSPGEQIVLFAERASGCPPGGGGQQHERTTRTGAGRTTRPSECWGFWRWIWSILNMSTSSSIMGNVCNSSLTRWRNSV